MKRFLLSVVLATSLAFTSCQFDDSDIWDKFGEMEESIRDHEQRISALEELCKQMNTNIEALQTLVSALEKRDYITNISPIREDGKIVGYTISFAYSDTVTIYHGKDGKDGQNGANGKDGYTPQIGVMKDTDGIYYWTLDGEWLLDGKGNKIQANGVNGTNGTNGSNGIDGVDGITPRLKIENDYWYVSYDNGVSWQQLGKATGNDGIDGENGEDGDSVFKSVTQDDEYVYFNLADGTMITLPKHDKENIQFEDLQVKAICCKNWDTNNDGELSYAEAAAVTDIVSEFSNNNIIALEELKFFTGISKIDGGIGGNSLYKIAIPKNVKSIFGGHGNGGGVFFNSPYLTYIHIYDLNNWCTMNWERGIEQSYKLLLDDKLLENLVIPNNVTSISKGAFCLCNSIKTIEIHSGVTSIAEGAFMYCSSLTSVTIGENVSSIKDRAFGECPFLRYVFCKSLTPPTLESNLAFTHNYDMIGCTIYVPRKSVENYKAAWYYYASVIQPYDFE